MTAPKHRRRPLRALSIAAQVAVGLGLGAAIAELAFSARDDGAFPHVNFYVADPALGVRLEPGATMRFRLRDNPVSTIRVNSTGYRGGEWPAPGGAAEVIVVGDSQVFGLGVDDDATFSAVLAERTGRTVINAGVPTYGPAEYRAVAEELLERRGAGTVVVALNLVNDPFELDRPNRERHAVWDGWAVRSETAPAAISDFPGRRWLMSRSHAVYALRRWLHREATQLGTEEVDPLDLGTPSEGLLGDLVARSKEAQARALAEEAAAAKALAAKRARLGAVDGELAERRDALDAAIVRHSNDFDWFDRKVAKAQPGDIVEEEYAESSRSVLVTAALLREAARKRQRALDEAIEAEARRAKRGAGEAEPVGALVAAEAALVAERQRLRDELAAGTPAIDRPPGLFRDTLAAFKEACAARGAALVVVALPIDVQVDPREWAKYGVAEAPDMSEAQVLIDDLLADAEALEVPALDATAALRAASPGAFLDHDIHMTAKGHAALAEALAATLAAGRPARLVLPGPGLPAGLRFAPPDAAWTAADEIVVKGSSAAGCTTQVRDGWLRVQCRRQRPKDRLDGIEVLDGSVPATMALRTEDGLSLVTPLTPGHELRARLRWRGKTRDLEVGWPRGEDGAPRLSAALVDVPGAPTSEPPPTEEDPLCRLHQVVRGEHFCADPGVTWYDEPPPGCRRACASAWGDRALLPACEAAFPRAASDQLACAQNDPLFAPPCPEGQVHAFASNRCFAACDDAHPCAAGACTPWQGGGVCL